MDAASMVSTNLFTDIYQLRQRLYGEDPAARIASIRSEVAEAIRHDCAPEHVRYLLLKTTNRCNSDCEYCQHAISRAACEPKTSVPHDALMRIIDEAADLGVDAISISGGEPLLRPDICEAIHAMVDRRIVPVLLTNGLLLDRMWRDLADAGLRYVTISVDSVDQQIYERQRGASFEQAMRGIDAACALREEHPEAEIHVSAVLTRDNQNDFLKLLAYMNERAIKVQISPYHPRRGDAEDYSIVDRAGIERLTAQLVELKRTGTGIGNSYGFLRHLPDFFCSGSVMPRGFSCRAGLMLLAIDAHMDVKPCWSYRFAPVGNLAAQSMREIWQSDKMQAYRRRMLRCSCEGCWYLCTSEACMMLEENGAGNEGAADGEDGGGTPSPGAAGRTVGVQREAHVR